MNKGWTSSAVIGAAIDVQSVRFLASQARELAPHVT